MKKQSVLLPLALLVVISLLLPASLLAQPRAGGGKNPSRAAGKPFLITGRLPHLTMLLKQQWDNPALALSAEQKDRLLTIRKETLAAVLRIKQELAPLEEAVARGIMKGETPQTLKKQVERIAALKTEATLVHLRCISQTRQVLSPKQLSLLLTATAGK